MNAQSDNKRERWASWAEPSLKIQTPLYPRSLVLQVLYVSILPILKTRHKTALPCKLCNLARHVVVESIGCFIHVWTPKRSLHTHLCGTIHSTFLQRASINLEVVPHTVHTPLPPSNTTCGCASSLGCSKALHVSESKLAHNDIIVWGPQGVKTQVPPRALVVACPLSVAPLLVTLLLHFLSCRRSVVQRCTLMAAPADGEAPSFPGLAERLHEAMRVARLGQKNLVVESARPGFKRHPTSGTRSHWGFGDGIVPIVKPY